MPKKNFWKNKRVFVTGGTGFVGANLVRRLQKKGAKVKVFSGDIRHFREVRQALFDSGAEVVYHLAAQPLIDIGKVSPLKTFEINIKGTWNILETARLKGVERIVIASTTHVYGDNPNLPYKEEYYPQPSRPYETSKASADLLAQSYADTYELPVEVCRMVNLYGPGDENLTRIFPYVVNSLIRGLNPEIFDVGAVRDFLFIDDAVDAYLKLVEADLPRVKRARVINFGTGKPINVISLVKKIITLYGDRNLKLVIKPLPVEREKEIQKQYVSIKKAKKLLGWKPKTSLEAGIKKTIAWYRRNFKES